MEKQKKSGSKRVEGNVSHMEFEEGQEASDRISYSEKVRINIGDYEHREVFFGYSIKIKDDEKLEDAEKRAVIPVRKRVKAFEKRIRRQVKHLVDFDTMAKLGE